MHVFHVPDIQVPIQRLRLYMRVFVCAHEYESVCAYACYFRVRRKNVWNREIDMYMHAYKHTLVRTYTYIYTYIRACIYTYLNSRAGLEP